MEGVANEKTTRIRCVRMWNRVGQDTRLVRVDCRVGETQSTMKVAIHICIILIGKYSENVFRRQRIQDSEVISL